MRRVGTTSQQMRQAPRNAIYVWCNGVLSYPRQLALHLGRTDLDIRSPSEITTRLVGRRVPIIVDHSVRELRTLSNEQWEIVFRINKYNT